LTDEDLQFHKKMTGSISLKMWVAIGVPFVTFLMGGLLYIFAVGAWKGEITTRLTTVEGIAKINKEDAKNNEQQHRDEMWAMRVYLHSLDKNILVIATKLKIPRSELSELKLEMPKRNK